MQLTRGCSTACLALAFCLNATVVQGEDPLNTWSVRSSGASSRLLAVAFGNGTFVAFGNTGTVLSSSDGTTWFSQPSGIIAQLRAVTFSSGRFFAVGGRSLGFNQYQNHILVSSNGANWSAVYSGIQQTAGSLGLYGIAGGNGRFIAVGETKPQAGPLAVESNDGVIWTERFLPAPPTYLTWDSLYNVAWGNGRFFAVGNYGMAIYSDDGTNWLRAGGGSGIIVRSNVTYGGDKFASIANTPEGGYVELMTTNGSAGGSGPYPGGMYTVSFGSGLFIAVGATGRVVTAESPVAAWTTRPPVTTNTLHGVTYGNGTFVAVGASGTIIQSADVSQPYFKAINYDSTNGISLTIQSAPGATFALEASTDLSDWFKIAHLTNVIGTITTNDAIPSVAASRFYRTAP